MSVINYRRSVEGYNSQLGRKFLSDSLTPWWGRWSDGVGYPGAVLIAYDNLPTGDALGRVYRAMGQWSSTTYEFNQPQNIDGLQLDFWLKVQNADTNIILFISPNPATTMTTSTVYLYKTLYAAGSSPTTWAKSSIKMDTYGFIKAGTSFGYQRLPLLKCKSISVYRDATADIRTVEVAGMTIRRL